MSDAYQTPRPSIEYELDPGEAEALREQIETANTQIDEIEDLQLYVRHRLLLNSVFVVVPATIVCIFLFMQMILPLPSWLRGEIDPNSFILMIYHYAAPIAIILTFVLYRAIVTLLGWSRQAHRLKRARQRLQEALEDAEAVIGSRTRYRNTRSRETIAKAAG